VCEELFCRYAVLRLLAPYGKSGAVVLSALLFALLHRNFYQMPYAFVAGLFLGAVTLASGGIACAIIFHILNNSLSTILYYSSDKVNAAVYIACFICAILYAAICSHSSSPARILSLRDASVKPMLLHSCFSLVALFALYALLVSI
jgi:membrane protease YdiL (CAAX protease family)